MEQKLIQQLFKTEYSKIIAVLCKLFGLTHIEIAEDIATDTFLVAAETWPEKGTPENPTAWLYQVAKNKTKDYIKRNQTFSAKIAPEIQMSAESSREFEPDLSPQNLIDSQLQMIFAICNPVIPSEAQIGLALRILCGFGIDEIAAAFLTNKETINKRLNRAKEKLRTENKAFQMPPENELAERLENVLTTLYLLFNEGCYSRKKNAQLRPELSLEAMRLTYFLLEIETTNQPKTNALMALMCFHSSRFPARTNTQGDSILYENQNRDMWDEELIARGNFYLIESAKGHEISKYHLEASIAYWHSTKTEHANKWNHILQLYNQLLQIEYSTFAALNRSYAYAKVHGAEKGISETLKLDLTKNHFYHALLGNLYRTIDKKQAQHHYEMALQLAKSGNEQKTIRSLLEELDKD